MVVIRMVRGRTSDEHGQGPGNLVLADPLPGEVTPVRRRFCEMKRMHAVRERQALAHRRVAAETDNPHLRLEARDLPRGRAGGDDHGLGAVLLVVHPDAERALREVDPRDVVGAIELSRATYRKMAQNLVWATAYNLVAIPIAAGLFVRWGLSLPMSLGAIAMSLSTIIVAANAQLLRRLRLRGSDG